MKLLLTQELGRLAKWLRILGCDAEYSAEDKPAALILCALRDERIILTRNHRLPAGRGLKIIILEKEKIKEQLAEALKVPGLRPEPEEMFSRCTLCNKKLTGIEKDKIREKVPEYVYNTQQDFFCCPSCGRVYWKGTHWGNVEEMLKEAKI